MLKASSMFVLAPFVFVGTMFTIKIVPGGAVKFLKEF